MSALLNEGIPAISYCGDVRSHESAKSVVAHVIELLGGLDILVNSAAGNFLANASELSLKGFKTVIDIDTVGVFNMSTAAYDALRASGSSNILNISACLHYGATWYQAHASAAKAAIDSLTRSFGLEWGEYGIRVTGIAPGPIADTPGMTKLGGGMTDEVSMEEYVSKGIPAGRLGTKFDIAMAAIFLCSGGATYITGHTLVVDGGQWLPAATGGGPPIPREMVSEMSRGIEGKSRAMGPGTGSLGSKL